MTELSMPVSLSIPTTYSECLQLGVCFVCIATENVKVMQNVKILEFKTIIKLTVVQKYEHGTFNK